MTDDSTFGDDSMSKCMTETVQTTGTSRRPLNVAQKAVVDYVEVTFNKILIEIQKRPPGHPEIILRRITALTAHEDIDTGFLSWDIQDREARYGFPGKTKEEAWRFACLGRILSEIHEAILTGVTVTKREIFYREPELFKKQETVDRYIDDIAHTCGVKRADLNVTAAAKGLAAGLDPSQPEAVELISSPNGKGLSASFQGIKWVLVVEKEAVFRLLAEKHITQTAGQGRSILVTAKGYPDLITRGFLRNLVNEMKAVNDFRCVVGLFDGDPDGIAILQTYRFGSRALAREHETNVQEIQWLGVELKDSFQDAKTREATKEMTPRDRTRARGMLMTDAKEAQEGVNLLDSGLRVALQHMLMLNRKIEIEALKELEGGTTVWIQSKLEALNAESLAW